MENRNYFTERDVERLETQAVQIRQDIISMIHSAKAGHPGGSLSAVEMVTALYFHVMNIKPESRSGRTVTGSSSPKATPARCCTHRWRAGDSSTPHS